MLNQEIILPLLVSSGLKAYSQLLPLRGSVATPQSWLWAGMRSKHPSPLPSLQQLLPLGAMGKAEEKDSSQHHPREGKHLLL